MFYNSNTGEAAIGEVVEDNFRIIRAYNPGEFAANWSHIVPVADGFLFYNKETGDAASGSLNEGEFRTRNTFPPKFLGKGWTHICAGGDRTLFYNASNGAGLIVASFNPFTKVKSFPANSFSNDWTHITAGLSYLMLFYNAANGRGAISEWFYNGPPIPQTFSIPNNDIRTLVSYKSGDFTTGWTHVISPVDNGKFLFYNQLTGAGALGILTQAGFETTATFSDFATGWTNIVILGDSIVFYNASNGAGAIGFNPTVKIFPAGTFSTGWTHLVSKVDLIPPIVH